MPHNAAIPLNGVTLDPATKGKDMECLGLDHDMLQVDRSLNAARLIRALEMPGQVVAVLNDLEIVSAGLPIVTLGVKGPVAADIGRRLIGRWLLGKGRVTNDHRQECEDGNRRLFIFPHVLSYEHGHEA